MMSGSRQLIHRVLTPVLSSVVLLAGTAASMANPHAPGTEDDIVKTDPKEASRREGELVNRVRQLTFEGRRAGEGYFSADGTRMVFQSEREAGNPFFQIYLMDLETGDSLRVSPGHGKTTCAWIHPQDNAVLFASTHADPEAKKKQQDEIDLRESGKQRRYSWDYDQTFDVWRFDVDSGEYTQLTQATGYDAEGSWSPDGRHIAFASNRRAYEGKMSEDAQKKFDIDPAYMIDIYLADGDGSNPRQLTKTPGYDGGPFFSPNGKKICWRRFSVDGATAEIMTMNIDGSDEQQLTHLEAMSWAPYFHPTGEYLIFTTNRHGFSNFELYLVRADGKSDPVRVTHTAGFDGLPVFSPDGNRLAWTTNRTSNGKSQIFIGEWNHEHARKVLGLDGSSQSVDLTAARTAAAESGRQGRPEFAPADIVRHVEYLCRPELGGRLTGTEGEKLATEYVAAYFESLGLEPAGDEGGWFQEFTFTSGVDLGEGNVLRSGEKNWQIHESWRPVSFSATGEFESAPVVFAGYGIAAPAADGQEEYDSFVHLDVKDKWVLAFRYMPEKISAERRQHLSTHSSLRYKTMLARDKGARGLIVVSGPNSNVRNQLIAMRFDGSISGSSLPVISITDEVAEGWLKASGKNLKSLQDKLDTGDLMMGFEIEDANVSAQIDIKQVQKTGRNVLGRLQLSDKASKQAVIVGAHIDHLGVGAGNGSLAREDEKDGIHTGADDNASGVAAMLEIAEYLSGQKSAGRLKGQHDVVFAAWSGEEMGLIGSSHFASQFKLTGHGAPSPHHAPHTPAHPQKSPAGTHSPKKTEKSPPHSKAAPHGKNPHASVAHSHSHQSPLASAFVACLNLDMVGRLEDKLVLQGVGSSSIWRSEIERRNAPVGLPITIQEDSYLPTDASTFFMKGVPILSAFTGSHEDYHTPRDTPDKLNYEGAADIARLMGLVARGLVLREEAPDYIAQKAPEKGQRRANLRAWLGTIPDYAQGDIKGLKLSGVSKGGPASKAGLKGQDIIVELAGKKIENIYDYTYAIEALKIGEEVTVVVLRGEKKVSLKLTPGSRE